MRSSCPGRPAWLVALGSLLLVLRLAFADDGVGVVGIWKLVSYEVEFQSTGKKDPIFGEKPTGYVVFTPEQRVFILLTAEGRKPAKTDEERAELLMNLLAFTGRYRLEEGKWITSVDVAWSPAWVGTEQVYSYKVNADRLQVLTQWRVMTNWPNKDIVRTIITFERAK